jgi:hypothetical protein|tara:strand:+ start:324 stop:608 length:285 start_codon:yes stop_codon:yes gene_type:complete
MIYIVTISVLSVLVVILLFTTINLLRKNEKAEDIVVGYLEYLDKFSRIIEASNKKLKEVDNKKMFEKDDDVGVIFDSILKIQDILNEFNVKNYK